MPSSVSLRSQVTGVSPAGTISSGYSYFSEASEKLHCDASHSVLSSHSGSYSAARRPRARRCCSALPASCQPHCATGMASRVAVSVSCSGLRERRCISTSPAATMRRPV